MLNKERKSKTKVKGSVLYTVVAVMMIMTVFIFAALSLASAANRRAFNSYANNQTQYTARSIIESIWAAMDSDTSFKNQFTSLVNPGDSAEIDVKLPASSSSMGTIDVNPTVTLLGKGNDYGYDSEKNMYKITATIKMVGYENTVSGYFLADRNENDFSFNYAVVSLGDASSNTLDNLSILGGASTGSSMAHDINLRNQNAFLQNPANVNGNLGIYASGAHILLSDIEDGAYINGNLHLDNAGTLIRSEVTGQYNYKQLPYVYVNGNISYSSSDQSIGSTTNPVLLMANTLDQGLHTNSFPIYGDVYLYSNSTVTNMRVNGDSGGVQKWVGGLVNKRDNRTGYAYTGGNLYSLGTVNISGNGGYLANNVVADTLNISASSKTDGTIVSEKVNIINSGNNSFSNGLFTNPDNFSCAYDTYINGHKFYEPVMGSHMEQNYAETRNVESNIDEMLTIQYNGDKVYLYYDFSSVIPDDSEEISIVPESIAIDWEQPSGQYFDVSFINVISEFQEQNSSGGYNYRTFYETSPVDIKNAENMAILSGTSLKMLTLEPTQKLTQKAGRIELKVEPGSWEDYNKNNKLYIKTVSVNFNITGEKIVEEVVDQISELDFLKKVNDNVFDNRSNAIYIDDIDKSVKIEKYIDVDSYTKLKISKAEFKSTVNEGNELDRSKSPYTDVGVYYYDTQYDDFLKSVVNTVTFPQTMKKENSGTKAPSFVNDSFLEQTKYKDASENEIDISKEELEARKETDKAFGHIGETSALVYNFNNGLVECSDGTTYYSGDTVEIAASCTFKGSLTRQITIKPISNNIYIKLDNFNIINMSGGTAIIVDDSGGNKKVNFLIPKNCGFYTNGGIITKTYNEMSNYDILQNPSNQNEIPGIVFYMEYDKTNSQEFKIDNKAFVTAYIMAPTGKFWAEGGSKPFSYTVSPTHTDSYLNLAIIGGVVFKDISLGTACAIAYVNPKALIGGGGDGGDSLSNLSLLYYQSY